MARERDRRVPLDVGLRIVERLHQRRGAHVAWQRAKRIHRHLAHTGVARLVHPLDLGRDSQIARRAERPDGADARLAFLVVERLDEEVARIGRNRRRQPAQSQRQILPHSRIVVARRGERFHELRRERRLFLFDELRIAHQPRQLVGGGPSAVAAARLDVGQIFLGRSILGQQASKPHVDQHGGARHEHHVLIVLVEGARRDVPGVGELAARAARPHRRVLEQD